MLSLLKRFLKASLSALDLLRRIIVNLVFVLLVILVISTLPRSTPLQIPEQATLVIEPRGTLVDAASSVALLDHLVSGPAIAETPLPPLLETIRTAAEDERITALVLKLDEFEGGGFSKLRELGEALLHFRNTGKAIFALADTYDQSRYYLAMFAHEIIVNPMGAVELEGFGSYQPYLRDALEHLNIDVHIFRVGEFKSAVEPFERSNMSPQSRASNQAWLNSLWQLYLDDVSRLRGLPAQHVMQYINNPAQALRQFRGDSATLALEAGLVDRIMDRGEAERYLSQVMGHDPEARQSPFVDGRQYASQRRSLRRSTPGSNERIGVIIAQGTIYDGHEQAGNIGGDTLAELIREARQDDGIRGLVLRIDSGGGSAFASEIIRQALLDFRASGRPVIVSMSSTAASGAYWIASAADYIFASPATITGSIGIYAMYPTFNRALDSLGIHVDGVGTTDMTGAFLPGQALPAAGREAIQLTLENGYARFIQVVSEGRNMHPQAVDAVAQGQVWSGIQAQERGLIDGFGSLEDAIGLAAEQAGVMSPQVQYIEQPVGPFELLLRNMQQALLRSESLQALMPARRQGSLIQSVLQLGQQVEPWLQLNDPRGLYLHCMECRQ